MQTQYMHCPCLDPESGALAELVTFKVVLQLLCTFCPIRYWNEDMFALQLFCTCSCYSEVMIPQTTQMWLCEKYELCRTCKFITTLNAIEIRRGWTGDFMRKFWAILLTKVKPTEKIASFWVGFVNLFIDVILAYFQHVHHMCTSK